MTTNKPAVVLLNVCFIKTTVYFTLVACNVQRAEQPSTTETILYDLLTAHCDRFYSSLSPATNHINSRLTTVIWHQVVIYNVINAYLPKLLSRGWRGVGLRIKEVREREENKEGRKKGKRKMCTNRVFLWY